MGSSNDGCCIAIEGVKMSRRSSRRAYRTGLASSSRRQSMATSMGIYEKWRLMLALLVYGLVAQWIFLLPVVLVALLYSICHRSVSFCVNLIISIFSKPYQPLGPKQTVLVNGCSQAVTLHLARLLNSAGHRVIACDFPLNWFNPTRFSNAVDTYYTVPNPRRGVHEYVQAMCDIAKKEKVDVFIPASRMEDLRFDFFTKTPLEQQGCRVFIFYPWSRDSLVAMNNNNENETVSCEVDGMSDGINAIVRRSRLSISSDESTPEDDEKSLLADLSGFHSLLNSMEKFTSTSFVCNGKIASISTSPNNPDSKFKLNQAVNDQIIKWSYMVLKQLGPGVQSGSLTFDLVMSEDGRVFPLSCGPYIGLPAINLEKQPELIHCLMQPNENAPERPLQSVVKKMQFCIYPEIMSLIRKPSSIQLKSFFKQLLNNNEAFFDPSDPLPFFTHYHLHVPFLMGVQLMRGRSWTNTDIIHGKLL